MSTNPYTQEVKAHVTSNPGRFSYQEVGAQFNLTAEQVRCIARQHGLTGYFRGTKSGGAIISQVSSFQLEEAIMREPTNDDLVRLRQICEERGLPFDRWGVYWDKTRESSIAFYNKKAVEEDRERQEQFLRRLEKAGPAIQKKPAPSKNLAIFGNFDVHVGKHCELIRTGVEYTPEIAVKQVLEGQAALYEMTKPFGVSDILLPMGNDIVHVDNNRGTTTSGTPQDSYGSVESQMYLAAELYIRTVEEWAKTHTVWLSHVHSNHDRVSGWAVSQMVSRYFTHHPKVHVSFKNLDQRHRKYFVFGNSLIMFHHGEAKEERLLGVIKAEANEALAQTNRVYVYQGHVHHKQVNKRGINTEQTEKDHSGITVIRSGNGAVNQMHVETLRSPSPADDWHAQQLYKNIPSVEVFLHNERHQFCRLTHEF